MGKKRITEISEEPVTQETAIQEPVTETVVEAVPEEKSATKAATKAKTSKKKTSTGKKRARGKKYAAAKVKIDPTRIYPPAEAIKLAKETSYAKFGGSLEVHLVTVKKGLKGEVALPHLAGKKRRVEIATKDILERIDAGKIDFDVLIATPAFMPNLVKYAKVLGPRGLMPNPKNGTIVDDPEKAVAAFQQEAFTYKTEPNAPLIHTAIGKISQADKELEANFQTLIAAIGPKNIQKTVVKASMGPAVKVSL